MSDKTHEDPASSLPALGAAHRTRDLWRAEVTEFAILPNERDCASIAAFLGVQDLRKMRFEGRITSAEEAGLILEGHLGATLSLQCVISLKQFNLRIEAPVRRVFRPDAVPEDVPGELALATDFDEDIEPLEDEIDPGAIAIEELALQVPAYPRAPEASLEQSQFSAPGVIPLTDAAASPFAALAALKAKSDT